MVGCRFAGVLGVVGIPMLVLSSVAAAGVWCGFASVLHMVRYCLSHWIFIFPPNVQTFSCNGH